MRIHECSYLDISFRLAGQLGVCAGAPSSSDLVQHCRTAVILENSSHIMFELIGMVDEDGFDSSELLAKEGVEGRLQTQQRPLLEVQDFNWLRSGIPSPNFEIRITKLKESNHATAAPPPRPTAVTSEISESQMETGEFSAVPAAFVESKTLPYPFQIATSQSDDDDDDEL